MTSNEKHSLAQMIANVRESIQQKWGELHDTLASAEQRKAARAEIRDAVAGLGKTIKQFDPRRKAGRKTAKRAKTTAQKKKSSSKKKSPARVTKTR